MESPALFEIHSEDEQGVISAFRIRHARIAIARDLISERAQQLADSGRITPITYEEVDRLSNGMLRSHEQEQISGHPSEMAAGIARSGRFQLLKSGDNYYVKLVADNGKVLLTSDFYDSREAAIEAMEAARTAAESFSFFRSVTETIPLKDKN